MIRTASHPRTPDAARITRALQAEATTCRDPGSVDCPGFIFMAVNRLLKITRGCGGGATRQSCSCQHVQFEVHFCGTQPHFREAFSNSGSLAFPAAIFLASSFVMRFAVLKALRPQGV